MRSHRGASDQMKNLLYCLELRSLRVGPKEVETLNLGSSWNHLRPAEAHSLLLVDASRAKGLTAWVPCVVDSRHTRDDGRKGSVWAGCASESA
jgi:hypothetical protein